MFTAFILLLATAQTPAADIRDTCGTFEVRLQSASGDAMEDDMRVTVAFAGGEPVAVPLPPGLFTPRAPLRNVTNLCQQLTALDAGGDRVLLLLSRNHRPGWDRLDAVLLDVRKHRILDARSDLGEIKSEHALVTRAAGAAAYDVLLVSELLENSGCDCAEAAIEDWLRLTVKGTKVFTAPTRRSAR